MIANKGDGINAVAFSPITNIRTGVALALVIVKFTSCAKVAEITVEPGFPLKSTRTA